MVMQAADQASARAWIAEADGGEAQVVVEGRRKTTAAAALARDLVFWMIPQRRPKQRSELLGSLLPEHLVKKVQGQHLRLEATRTVSCLFFLSVGSKTSSHPLNPKGSN
jgi:hypothetical protein